MFQKNWIWWVAILVVSAFVIEMMFCPITAGAQNPTPAVSQQTTIGPIATKAMPPDPSTPDSTPFVDNSSAPPTPIGDQISYVIWLTIRLVLGGSALIIGVFVLSSLYIRWKERSRKRGRGEPRFRTRD